jgi:hypothetical protein
MTAASSTEMAIDACARAIERIENDPSLYKFTDWSRCAVGHLYWAVTGHSVDDGGAAPLSSWWSGPEEHHEVLDQVAQALGRPATERMASALWISEEVNCEGGYGSSGFRSAVRVLQRARRALRQKQAAERRETAHDYALV